MRFYPVPFSAKEEEKLAFNLTTREIMVLSIGITLGLLVAWLTSLILDTYFIFCIPIGLPFVGISALLAFVKVNKSDAVMTLENYIFRLIRFKQRPRHYLKERQKEKWKER
jgi:uncharacterized protein YacL